MYYIETAGGRGLSERMGGQNGNSCTGVRGRDAERRLYRTISSDFPLTRNGFLDDFLTAGSPFVHPT
jgi:hypothetical protein